TRWLSAIRKPPKLEKQWQNRIVRDVPANKIHCYPILEITARMHHSRDVPGRAQLRIRNDRFQKMIPDENIAASKLVIGFDTSSQILAKRAKAHGKRFILDRSIGHPRFYQRVLERLADRFPAWLHGDEGKTENELALEDEEHELADQIVVPSRFVANTLL